MCEPHLRVITLPQTEVIKMVARACMTASTRYQILWDATYRIHALYVQVWSRLGAVIQ